MTSAAPPDSHPAVLLVNELEILSTQARLIELYLKQGSTTQFSEIALLRAQYEEKVGAISQEFEDALNALEERAGSTRELEFRARLENLENQLAEKQCLLDSNNAEIERARLDKHALQERLVRFNTDKQKAEVEAAHKLEALRQQYEAAAAALRKELDQRRLDLEYERNQHHASQEQFNSEIEETRSELVRTRAEILSREREIEQLRSVLEQRCKQLETELAEREAEWARQDELFRSRGLLIDQLQSELAVQKEVAAKLPELESQLQQKQEAIAAAQTNTEQIHERLNSRIRELEVELAQTGLLAQQRAILVHELNARIVQLLEELGQRDSETKTSIAEHEAAIKLQQTLGVQIQSLQKELTEKEAALEGCRERLCRTNQELDTVRQSLVQMKVQQQEVEDNAGRTGRKYESELSVLQNVIEEKNRSLAEHEAAYRDMEQRLRDQVRNLERQLAEQLSASELRSQELTMVSSEKLSLVEQLADWQMASWQAQTTHSLESGLELERLHQKAPPDFSRHDPLAGELQEHEITDKDPLLQVRVEDSLLEQGSIDPAEQQRYQKLQELLASKVAQSESQKSVIWNRRWRSGFSRKRRWRS